MLQAVFQVASGIHTLRLLIRKVARLSLGGGYRRLTYPRGWAEFDINEHNRALLDFFKEHEHYISRVEEKDGKYYVTFKHS